MSPHQQWPPLPHQALLQATLPLCPMVEWFPWSWTELGWDISSARAMECSGAEHLAAIWAALFPPSLRGNSPLSLTTDHCPQPLLLLPWCGFAPKIGNCVRREEKQSGWDLCSWEGTQKKRETDYMVGHPPWEVSRSSRRLSIPVLGSYLGKTSPVTGWKTAGTKRRAREAQIPLMRSLHTLASHVARWREQLSGPL